MWTYGGSEIHAELWLGNLKVRDDLQDTGGRREDNIKMDLT